MAGSARYRYGIAAVLLLGVSALAAVQQSPDPGSTTISPAVCVAGAQHSWTITHTVGPQGIDEGGSIQLQFPRTVGTPTWMYKALKPYVVKHFQTGNPEGWDYVGASCSRTGVTLRTSILRKTGINPLPDRIYWQSSHVFQVTVTHGRLEPGDRVEIVVRNTSAGVVRETTQVLVAVGAGHTGHYDLVTPAPRLTTTAAEAREMLLYGPAQAVTGEPARYHISVLDMWGNQTEFFRGQVHLSCDDPQAELPETLEMTPADSGLLEFRVVYRTPGTHRVTLVDNRHLANTGLLSNPVIVGTAPAPLNVYWGELHSHSRLSNPAIGEPEGAYRYGRDVARLDFMALTPQREARNLRREDEMELNRTLVKRYHDPLHFLTFLGYEWQTNHPNNVIWRNDDAVISYTRDYPTLDALWKALDGQDVLTIPHHTGIVWNGWFPGYREDMEERRIANGPDDLKRGGAVVDWSYKHPLRRLGEIYSLHGSSEYFGCVNNYEDVDNTLAAAPGPYYFRDAWERGQMLGVVGSTDNHFAHPGRIYGGVTGVYAETLTRDAVFTALQNRQTFATTGHRTLLRFSMNDHLMGSIVRLQPDETPAFHLTAHGTDVIDVVEVFKYDGFRWTTLLEHRPNAMDVDLRFTDRDYAASSLYYVRLIQKALYQAATEHRPRRIMAWSSPIWATNRDTAWWDVVK